MTRPPVTPMLKLNLVSGVHIYMYCTECDAKSIMDLRKDGRNSFKNITVYENLADVSLILVGEYDARRERIKLHGKLQSAQLNLSQIATENPLP